MRFRENNAFMQTVLISILTMCCLANLHAQNCNSGLLEAHIYNSSIKGPDKKKMYVYLPSDYHTSEKYYPVVYFLHGANGNERSWIEYGHILNTIDSLTTLREIPECIYVFPNTNKYYHELDYIGSRPKNSLEAFLSLNGSAEHSFIHDIMKYVDSQLRTLPYMEKRAIAGLSLGGLQTLYISANCAGTFGYIGLFSPIIYPPSYIGGYSFMYNNLEKKLDTLFAFSPALYMIMIGEDDPFFKSAYYYSNMLHEHNHDHIFTQTKGGHTWSNWSEYSIAFLKSLWHN